MKYRIIFRQRRYCVQQRHGIFAALGEGIARYEWSTVRWGAHRFRLLARIHLVVLRERAK